MRARSARSFVGRRRFVGGRVLLTRTDATDTTAAHGSANRPPVVSRIFIVGAGGFGREVLQWARDAWPDHAALIAGFLSAESGSIICPFAIVSDSARVGSHALLNYHASLGHDASTGDYAVLSPYATLGGNAHIGDDVFLGMHASVGPGRRIGARSKVSANSCALADAPADSIIYGVPGRVGPLIR